MKCNILELAHLSDQPCLIEGRLNYRKISQGSYRNQTFFKERWFRLINNYLFYFKLSEMGKFDTKNPAGVFVMENSSIQMEHGQSIPFSFSVSFIDEPEKRHMFAARSEDHVVQWVMKLRECSYEYLRNRLHSLQSKIYSITGKDPLLLVPRNDGACLWAPSVPFSTTPACTVNTSSFSCHLHTNGGFTLERSKSDVQAYVNIHKKSPKATFYTDDNIKKVEDKKPDSKTQMLGLERSKTSAIVPPLDSVSAVSIFENRPAYSRAAPSPPVRTKLSPRNKRAELNPDMLVFNEQSKHYGVIGILDEMPVPPRRKISPKPETRSVQVETQRQDMTEDLIKF